MSALDAAREHYLARFEAFERSLSAEPAWLTALRHEALGHFRDQGFPHTKLEEWRYTNVTPLARVPFELPPPVGALPPREVVEEHCVPTFACNLYVFVDGRFAPELSPAGPHAGAVSAESLARLRAEQPEVLEGLLGSLVDTKQHPFAALATAFLDDGAVLRVPRGVDVASPIHLVFATRGGAAPSVTHPRVLIDVAPGARACVIQDHVSLAAGESFSNAVTEVQVGAGAELQLVLLQREDEAAFGVSNLAVRQQRDSRFAAHTLALGGRLTRNDARVLLAEEGADCTLNGLFVAADGQLVDNHTLVDHAVPHGTSRERYKGALGGAARGVFRGRVIVRPDAQRTDATQSNANLLLSDGAEIDTKPQLEIHADDVKCSHGSSTGRIDENALFYLRSRGLAEALAREVLTRAFASEILASLPVPALADELTDHLSARLGRRDHA